MSTLARQGDETGRDYSLVRDNQFRAQLEAFLDRQYGHGVVSGGQVSKVSGFTLKVADETVLAAEGVEITLEADQQYTISGTPTVYLWGLVERTAADQTDPAAEDTYALDLTHNTSGTPPSALHILLAIVTTDGSGIVSINNGPDGKFIRSASPLTTGRFTIAAGETAVVEDGHQVVGAGWTVEVGGAINVNGTGRLVAI